MLHYPVELRSAPEGLYRTTALLLLSESAFFYGNVKIDHSGHCNVSLTYSVAYRNDRPASLRVTDLLFLIEVTNGFRAKLAISCITV